MNNGADVKQLEKLLCETKALINAIDNQDNLEIGRLLSKRNLTIEAVREQGGLGENPTESQKSLSEGILNLLVPGLRLFTRSRE